VGVSLIDVICILPRHATLAQVKIESEWKSESPYFLDPDPCLPEMGIWVVEGDTA
jgi:hypothetical protein